MSVDRHVLALEWAGAVRDYWAHRGRCSQCRAVEAARGALCPAGRALDGARRALAQRMREGGGGAV